MSSHPGSVRATVVVDVDSDTAFEVFTDEVAAWYRPIRGAPKLDADELMRFDEPSRRVLRNETEVGRITVWEKGRRLVWVDRRDTEVEVRFEPHGTQTRVTLEHRGLERLSPEDGLSVVQYGWRRLAFQFEEYVQQKQEES